MNPGRSPSQDPHGRYLQDEGAEQEKDRRHEQRHHYDVDPPAFRPAPASVFLGFSDAQEVQRMSESPGFLTHEPSVSWLAPILGGGSLPISKGCSEQVTKSSLDGSRSAALGHFVPNSSQDGFRSLTFAATS